MENNETKNVEVQPTEIATIEKKPNLVVKAGKWLWTKKWYLVTAAASFAAGALLSSGRDEVDDCMDYEEQDIGPEE